MNSLAVKISDLTKDEIKIIDELKELSLRVKDIVINRDLAGLDINNEQKKATLLRMLSLQRIKDSLISELADTLGVSKDSSVRDILDSKNLDEDSQKILTDSYYTLEGEIKALKALNALISTIILSSFKLNGSVIDIFNLHGTVGSTYSRNVKVKAGNRHSKVNRKI